MLRKVGIRSRRSPPRRRAEAAANATSSSLPASLGISCRYAVTGAVPSTCWTAATILSSFGITHASSGSLYGTVASRAVTCTIGAFSDENPCSATSPAITVAADAWRVAWSTSTSRPVFATDSRIVGVSSGANVRGSITSAWMPSVGERLGRPERAVDRPPRGDDRHVTALAPDRRLAERHEILPVGHLAVLEREQVVVQVDDRVVVADRGRHQPLRVGSRRRHDDLETGDAHEEGVDRARVLARPARSEPVPGLEDERNLDLPTRHGAEAVPFVDDLVHGDEHELGHVELDDGPEAGESSADRDPDLGRLGDRRDPDPVLAERVDVGLVLGRGHVLAEVEDRLVPLHLEHDRLVDGGDEGQFVCHGNRLLRRRCTRGPIRRSGTGSRARS